MLCPSVHFGSWCHYTHAHLLCFQNVQSLSSSLYSVSVSLSWLTQSFQGCLHLDMFKHTQAPAHHWHSTLLPVRTMPALPITFALHILSFKIQSGGRSSLSKHARTRRFLRHGRTLLTGRAECSVSMPLLPSIIPPHCRVEWQLAAEEPPLSTPATPQAPGGALSGETLSLSGSIRAKKKHDIPQVSSSTSDEKSFSCWSWIEH